MVLHGGGEGGGVVQGEDFGGVGGGEFADRVAEEAIRGQAPALEESAGQHVHPLH